mmetsp:Transcript_62905/g.137824  ORF Transcript_62905/g.137824 Transcript_62905/m.137824 type:complete len:210 (+) Transcript_62905:664-1293(+)
MLPCMLRPKGPQRSCRPNCATHHQAAETQALHGNAWARLQGKRSKCRTRLTTLNPGVPVCRNSARESSGEAAATPTWASCDRDSGPSWGLKVDRRRCKPSNAPGRSKTGSPKHLLVHILQLLEYSSDVDGNARQTWRRSPGLRGKVEDPLLCWVHLPRRRFGSRTSGDGLPWALSGASYWIRRAAGQPCASCCRRRSAPVESVPPFSPV